MKISNVHPSILGGCLILLFASSISHAAIYKWVDANGRTHYSEKKEDTDKAKAVKLKTTSQPSSTQYLQEQESKLKQSQPQILIIIPPTPPAPVDTRPKSLSEGRSDETDAGRCNLARDVISGAVAHTNGAPTDKYDLEVAENDIRAFCH